MAIFEDTRELSRQQRHIGMDKVKGWKKTALAIMGYKDTGEKNLWGKTGIPSSPTTRLLSKQLSKGTDTQKVFKETDDEWAAAELAKLKFAAEIAAVVAGGSAGGAQGATMAGKAASQSGNSIPSGATTPINPTSQSGNYDIASSSAGQNLTNEISKQGTQGAIDSTNSNVNNLLKGKTDSQLLNEFGEEDFEELEELDFIKTDEKGEYVLHEDGTKTYTDDLMEQDREILLKNEKRKRRQKRKEKSQEGLEQTVDLLNNTPIIGSGLDLVAKNRATTLAAEEEANIYKNKVASESQFNLL